MYIVWTYIWFKKHNLLKAQTFLFFSEALSMCNQIIKKHTDNSAT